MSGKRCNATENEAYIGVFWHADVEAKLPELRITDEALWTKVQARRTAVKAAYLRDAAGRLQSKPEGGLLGSRYALSGLVKCHVCGSGMKAYPAGGRDPIARYRCGLRARAGVSACSNALGIPVSERDEAVRLSVHEMLTQDPAAVASLVEERDALLQAEAGAQGDAHAAALEQAAKLKAEITNLVNSIARGVDPADVAAAIAERKLRVEELRATPAPPPRFDRVAFFKRFTAKSFWALTLSPSQLRAALRKLDIDEVRVYPSADGKGWSFESQADLAGILEDDSLTLGTLPERAG